LFKSFPGQWSLPWAGDEPSPHFPGAALAELVRRACAWSITGWQPGSFHSFMLSVTFCPFQWGFFFISLELYEPPVPWVEPWPCSSLWEGITESGKCVGSSFRNSVPS